MTNQREANVAERYDGVTIALHWISALLVLVLWGMAQLADLAPRGDPRHAIWSVHIALGIGLAGFVLARIVWRMGPSRAPVSAERGHGSRMAVAMHLALYALLAAVLFLGVANTAARDWDLFGFVKIPAFAPDDRALRRTINEWHELAANLTLVLAILHAGAAMFHHVIRRDQVLKRMLPARQ